MEEENQNPPETGITVEHDPVGQKFTAEVDGKTNVLAYTEVNDTWDIFEVAVDEGVRGRGIGEQLALAAFRHAVQHNIKIIPSCPYIKDAFLKKYPEFKEITTNSFY